MARGDSLDDARWRRHHHLLAAVLAVDAFLLAAVGFLVGSIYALAHAVIRPWLWAAAYGGLILVVLGAHLLAWWTTERGRKTRYERSRPQGGEADPAVIERLRETEEVKARLLAVAAHELRTPLTAIIGLTRTLSVHQGELDRRRVAGCVEGIEEHSTRLSRVVNNLLAASDCEGCRAGRVDLAPAVAIAVDDFADSAVAFEVCVPADTWVAIDGRAARRIVDNLVDNAQKFAPRGTRVTVVARRVGVDVELVVTNVLRPDDEAAMRTLGRRLFEPFVQGDSSDTRTAQGLGLGLHVVRNVATACGGGVHLRVEGSRACVVVTLPAAARVPLADQEPLPALPA